MFDLIGMLNLLWVDGTDHKLINILYLFIYMFMVLMFHYQPPHNQGGLWSLLNATASQDRY